MKQRGVTLLELTVSSALMGLLFFSGLQLLSSWLEVQASLVKASSQVFSLEKLQLEAQLRSSLQGAKNIEVLNNGKTLRFQLEGQLNTLSFRHSCGDYLLKQASGEDTSNILRSWKDEERSGEKAFRFELVSPHLLKVYLDKPHHFSIWLRNAS